jgi:hypothetical protein
MPWEVMHGARPPVRAWQYWVFTSSAGFMGLSLIMRGLKARNSPSPSAERKPEDASSRSCLLTDADLRAAHKACSNHRDQVLASDSCGCFYCCASFGPEEIKDWVDEGRTALCACGIDSLIGSASGWPVTRDFLQAMRSFWF